MLVLLFRSTPLRVSFAVASANDGLLIKCARKFQTFWVPQRDVWYKRGKGELEVVVDFGADGEKAFVRRRLLT